MIINPPHSLIIISVNPPIDDSVQVVKDWLIDKGYTSDDVRIRISDNGVWAELKDGVELR